ncbi:MAG: beta-ketoacyl-[acyl-carrier-protein] synthase II [Acidimicrobiia bacterium]
MGHVKGDRRRVVVTGMGAITPLGASVETTWEAMMQSKSGIGEITLFDASDLASRIAGEARDFDPSKYFEPRDAKHLDRAGQMGIAAATDAYADAKLDKGSYDPNRAGVIFSSGIGGISTLEKQFELMFTRGPTRLSPYLIPMFVPNLIAGQISIRLELKGPSSCVLTACAASANAVGDGAELIRRGAADVVLAGGVEAAICRLGVGGFCSMKALSTRNDEPQKACRPFDRNRDGFVIAEGAACLVLEEREAALARGARIYAEVLGYGLSSDAYHVTAPDPEGDGARRCMLAALEDAGIGASDLDYINAHGTSTPYNDRTETMAIKNALGSAAFEIPVSSTKSMTGHLLGAAGALESVVSVMALQSQMLPPTINLDDPDPECDLDYVPHKPRNAEVNVVMSNSFGFGGHNACLVFARPDYID